MPASVDSIPSSAMQEDHVSMGWSAARKLRRAVDGLTRVLAIELLTAARALDLRAPLDARRRATGAVVAALRAATSRAPAPTATSPPRSRPPSQFVASGAAVAAAESVTGPLALTHRQPPATSNHPYWQGDPSWTAPAPSAPRAAPR